MTRFATIALTVCLFACSGSTRETSGQDSATVETPVRDTAEASGNDGILTSTPERSPQDTSALNAIFDEQSARAAGDESKYYIVSVTVSQYEGSADVTWYFDKDLTPRYFKETWSFEGNEGGSELFIENDVVICAVESDNDTQEKWCKQTGGIRSTWSETAIREMLPPDYQTKANQIFKDKLAILKNILSDGTITSDRADSYIVRIESTADAGQEVTAYTEVDIPKKVYDELIR